MKITGKAIFKKYMKVLLQNVIIIVLVTSFFVMTEITLINNENKPYSSLKIAAEPYININVYDEETLLGIDSVSIIIYDDTDYNIYSDFTDSAGHLNVTLFTGNFTVSASKEAYYAKNTSVALNFENEGVNINMYLSPYIAESFIEATVFNEFGELMDGAAVKLQKDGVDVSTLFTGSDGRVNFTGLEIGNYMVTAIYVEYHESQEAVNINYGKEGKFITFHLVPLGGLGTIQVYAYELATGDTIEAYVKIYNSTDYLKYTGNTAQETGLFTAIDVGTGTYRITVEKDGVFPIQTKYCVIDFEGEIERIFFYLSPDGDHNGVIIVHTFNWEGIIIDGVLVSLYDESEQELVGSMYSNMSGIVNFTNLEKGWFQAVVSYDGYKNKTVDVNINYNGDIDHVYVYLLANDQESRLEIKVIDNSTLQPLDNVLVHVYSLAYHLDGLFGRRSVTASDYTNSTGHAEITGLEAGRYKVVVTKTGYLSTIEIINIESPLSNISLYFGLTSSVANARITVSVNDAAGDPVLFARVGVINEAGESVGLNFSNLYGECIISNLTAGWYNISVWQTGFIEQARIVQLYTSEYQLLVNFQLIKLEGTGFIHLHVYDSVFQPISKAVVEVYDKVTDSLVSWGYTKTAGDYNITKLRLARYRLVISAPGYVTVEKEVFIIGEGYGTKAYVWLPTYVPASCIEIKVHSFLSDLGNPNWIESATIRVYDSSGKLIVRGLTDSNGFFNATGLANGEYNVTVYASNYKEQSQTTVIDWDGDKDELMFTMQTSRPESSGFIVLYVQRGDGVPLDGVKCTVTGDNGSRIIKYTNSTIPDLGSCNITGLIPGHYTILLQKRYYDDHVIYANIGYPGDGDRIMRVLRPSSYGELTIETRRMTTNLADSAGVYRRFKGQTDSQWKLIGETDRETGLLVIKDLIPGENYEFRVGNGFYWQVITFNISIAYPGQQLYRMELLIVKNGDGVRRNLALLVVGSSERRFSHDTLQFYSALIHYYGFTHEDIILCSYRATDPVTGLDMHRDYQANATGLELAFSELSSRADIEDEVIIWWCSHGDTDYNIELNGNSLIVSAEVLDYYCDRVSCEKMYIFLTPCHSGGIIPRLIESNRAIYTSCCADQTGQCYWHHDSSYWPRAIWEAINPNYERDEADTNQDGKVSLYEIYYYAYTEVLWSQTPQRYVGYLLGGGGEYGGDEHEFLGTIFDEGADYQPPAVGAGNTGVTVPSGITMEILANETTIEVSAEVRNADSDFDLDDFVFFTYGFSALQVPFANITISIYTMNGTLIATNETDIDGNAVFYDIPDGEYYWEALNNGTEIASGYLVSDGMSVSVTSYAENWDVQGDLGDLKIEVRDADGIKPIPDAIVILKYLSGTTVATGITGTMGVATFFDLEDGLYAYEVQYGGKNVAEGQATVDSSQFTMETDVVPPVVNITSPVNGSSLTVNSTILTYEVTELYNFTVTVFVNGMSRGSVTSGENITTDLYEGFNFIQVIAVDNAGNTGSAIVEFNVTSSIPTTTTTTTTTTPTTTATTTTTTSTATTTGTDTTKTTTASDSTTGTTPSSGSTTSSLGGFSPGFGAVMVISVVLVALLRQFPRKKKK